jgi:subtilisin family serine protease
MQKNIITSALMLALASSSAVAADRTSFRTVPNAQDFSLQINKDRIASSTWLVKASSTQAVSLASATLSSTQSAIINPDQTLARTNASLDQLANRIEAMGLDVTIASKTNKLVAGLVIEASEEDVAKIRALIGVDSVLPVYDSELAIEDSAVYINATQLVAGQVASGQGVTVAVLDSGLDYTHADIGGPGTQEAFEEAIADLTDTPAWPIGSVLGGFDFFNGDPDPMDNNNHGTHVTHSVLGVAPDASIYIYTVCDVNCSGAAQLAALEAAMDPNGDGDISDRVDIINMSLGGDYGTSRGGAVAELIDAAVNLGVVVAISAGNDGAFPFIVGGPSTTNNALSVGAMTHPTTGVGIVSATLDGEDIDAPTASFNPDNEFLIDGSANIVYPEPETNATGCVPYTEDLTDSVAIIDRGECAFTTKVLNAQNAGASFVVVANNNEGEAPFNMAGTAPDGLAINSVMVSLENANRIKEGLLTTPLAYRFSSENIVVADAIADFTSRGPSLDGRLKPEITAPGVAIETAEVGTGDGRTPIDGTSFSSPITAGSVALLTEVFPNRSAFELKATLMNTANLDVFLESPALSDSPVLAPISYIGAGLVNVEKASQSDAAAWDSETQQAALSFGPLALSSSQSITKTVSVKNFSNETKVYTLADTARYSDDAESGALSLSYPASISVGAGQTARFDVTATFDPASLPDWELDIDNVITEAGSELLTSSEYDGVLTLTESGNADSTLQLVYHSLPIAYPEASFSAQVTEEGVERQITNTGVSELNTSLMPATLFSGIDESEALDIVAASLELVAIPSCDTGVGLLTTLTMRDPVMLTHQAGFFMDVDVDSDGVFDATLQTLNFSAFGQPTAESVSYVSPFGGADLSNLSFFFTDHEPGSNQITMPSCLGAYGLTADDLGTVNATIAFRIENSAFVFNPSSAYDDDLVGTFNFANASVPSVVNESGEAVDSLAPGESATLLNASVGGFLFADANGVSPTVVAADGNNAPTIDNQSFSVDENTANGVVVGTIAASDVDGITSPISEIFVQSSTSTALEVSRTGVITVANSDVLDFDAGLQNIEMQVVAIDTSGNISTPATITVAVNNVADEPSEIPEPPTPPVSSGGGAIGWLGLMLLPLTLVRRVWKR